MAEECQTLRQRDHCRFLSTQTTCVSTSAPGSPKCAATLESVCCRHELCAAQGDRHREAALHNNLADLLHETDRPEEAMEQLKRAVAIFADVGAEGEPQPEVWKLARW